MLRFFPVLAMVLLCLATEDLAAQRPEMSQPAGERIDERLERIFAATSPKLGKRIPKVTCYDAQGEKFRLRSLKGQYSVLLFGCLT